MLHFNRILIILPVFLMVACAGEQHADSDKNTFEDVTLVGVLDTSEAAAVDVLAVEESPQKIADWKINRTHYPHFKKCVLDTVYIGPTREIKGVEDYFREDRHNVFVSIDEGEYITSGGIWISGENIIVRGADNVSILCDKLYENVIWVVGDNVVLDNLHLMHLMRGEYEGQNCSGRVVGFDGADNVTVVNCDLNGCGLAGLHDNLGNGTVFVEYNYIHNNSLGAYTDIDGGIWQEEVDDHPVFKFKHNLILNNGFDRVLEEKIYEEDVYDH